MKDFNQADIMLSLLHFNSIKFLSIGGKYTLCLSNNKYRNEHLTHIAKQVTTSIKDAVTCFDAIHYEFIYFISLWNCFSAITYF